MPTITRDNCSIHYSVQGDGPPLLLIPGWGCSTESWGRLLPRLAKQYTCITVDNRGGGRSGRAGRFFSVATMADDAMAVVETLGYDKVHVLGNSLGGMVAQAAALRHRERIASLVLLSTSPGVASVPCHPSLLLGGVRLLQRRFFSRRMPVTTLEPEPSPAADEDKLGRFSPAQLLATMTWWGLPVLAKISTPTLIIHGADDPVIPPFNARLFERFIRGSRLRLIPGAGHFILTDALQAVASSLETFLSEHSPVAAPPPLLAGAPAPRLVAAR